MIFDVIFGIENVFFGLGRDLIGLAAGKDNAIIGEMKHGSAFSPLYNRVLYHGNGMTCSQLQFTAAAYVILACIMDVHVDGTPCLSSWTLNLRCLSRITFVDIP